MNILNAVEREAFDSPPVFNSFQRKQYFDFPSKLRRFAAGLRSPAYRVGLQVPKSLFILQVTDDPVLRQAIEKQMDRIEHVHRFTRAVSVGNPREFLQAEKEDQEMAEACKRLIKNCIICWNYLYLSQKLEEIKDTASREAFLDAVAHGSVVAWQHLNLLGEYDFSDEKLRDSIGIRPPKLVD
jgi:hypothetical protein